MSEPLEYCHTFDFSNDEEDSTLLNSISYISLSSVEDESLIAIILTAIQSFVMSCTRNECVGRIILNADELLSDNVYFPFPLKIEYSSKPTSFPYSNSYSK